MKTNSVSVTMRNVGDTDVSSNRALPIIPFPGLVLIDPNNKKVKVVQVSCLMHNFVEDDQLTRDPFGNAVSITVEPIE